MPATISIELKGLRFFANHGWQEEETIIGNEFEVNLVALFPAKRNITALYDTVDYGAVYAVLKKIFMETEPLLETVAQKIAYAIEANFREIYQVQISITKLTPPIPAFIGTVGITYTEDFR